MSEIEKDTVEGRLADIISECVLRADEYKLSDSDKAAVVNALEIVHAKNTQNGRTKLLVAHNKEHAEFVRDILGLSPSVWDCACYGDTLLGARYDKIVVLHFNDLTTATNSRWMKEELPLKGPVYHA